MKLHKRDETFLKNLCPAVRDDVRTWPVADQARFLHHLQKSPLSVESHSFSSTPSLSPDSIVSIKSTKSSQSSKSNSKKLNKSTKSTKSTNSNKSTKTSKKDKKKRCPKGTRRNKNGDCVEFTEKEKKDMEEGKEKEKMKRCPKGTRRNKNGDCVANS